MASKHAQAVVAGIRWSVVVAVAVGLALGAVLSERIEERRAERIEERASVEAQQPAPVGCTVNWLDSEAYQKPYCYGVTLPAVTNEYYIDFNTGSGTTCSQASPCANISDVYGKPGTTGGPAYIYIRGTSGQFSVTGTLYGSAGNEVVITHWPGETNPVVFTKGSGQNYTDAHIIRSTNIYHLILDGGEDMLIRFLGSGSGSLQNDYTFVASSDNVTVRRVRIDGNGDAGPVVGIATGPGIYRDIRLINSEIYNGNYYAVYTGGGTGCNDNNTEHDNVSFINNIFRDVDVKGIQVEPRSSVASDNTVIEGNAFHDIALVFSSFSSVNPANACGGTITNVHVRNNLFFDLGQGGVINVGPNTPMTVYNNTIYNFSSKGQNQSTHSHGISSSQDGQPLTVKNNIVIYTPSVPQMNCCNRTGGWTANANVDDDGSCSTGRIPGTRDNTFASYSNTSTDHLKLKAGSPAIDAGENLFAAGVVVDYAGVARPGSGAFDAGAFEY